MRQVADGKSFTADIQITEYPLAVNRHYGPEALHAGEAEAFQNFGLVIAFGEPTELLVYDAENNLDPLIKDLVAKFGAVIFRNTYLSERKRSEGQRNIFGSLVFHLDRGHHFDNRFSLFVRDPFDPIQREPRRSSTLIISNRVAELQARREGEEVAVAKPRYNIFMGQNVRPLLGSVMLDQRWDAPAGTGEMCIIDNRSVYHASYYEGDKGYPIGVRYLY